MAGTKMLTVSLILKAIDEMSGPLKNVAGAVQTLDKIAERTEGLKQLGENLETLGRNAMIAGGLMTASLAAPIAAFKSFEDAETRARLAYMTGGGVDPLFPAIARQAKELGDALPGTTKDFEQMAGTLKELGERSDAISEGGLKATAFLRVLLPELGSSQTAEMMVGFERGLGLAQRDFVTFVDYAQRAKFGFGLDLVSFAETAKYAGPLLSVMGVKGLEGAKDILVLSGAMTRAGVSGSMMGTELRETLARLAQLRSVLQSNKEVADILGSRGIQLRFFDSSGTFLGMENLIGQVEKLNVLSQEQRMFVMDKIFGERAATMNAIASAVGVAGFRQLRGELEAQAPLMDRVNEVLGTVSSKWEAAEGTGVNALAAIGRAIAPDIKAFLDLANAALGWISDFAEEHQTAIRVLLYLVGTIGVATLAFGAFVFTLGSALVAINGIALGLAALPISLRLLSVWTSMATGAVWRFTAALFANPITWVVGAAIALAGAAYLIYRNWGQIASFFSGVWQWLEAAGARMYEGGANLVDMLWRGIKSVASKPIELFRSIVQGIRDHLPFSPAKVGPLRDLNRVKIIETIAGTMKPGPMLTAMSGILAASMSAAAPATRSPKLGGAAPVIHYAPVNHFAPGISTDVRQMIEEMQRQHAAELLRIVESAMADRDRAAFGNQ